MPDTSIRPADPRAARLRSQAADALAERLREFLGTDTFFIVDMGFTFVQAMDKTDDEATGFLMELRSNEYIPKRRALSRAAEDTLREIGFHEPTKKNPNWSAVMGYEHGDPEVTAEDFDEGVDEVARAAVDALIDAYQLSPEFVAGALGVRLPTRRRTKEPRLAIDADGTIAGDAMQSLMTQYAQTIRADRATPYATPWDSQVEPSFFCVVDRRSPDTVDHLVALTPTSPNDPLPMWWYFSAGGWVRNPFVTDDLSPGWSTRLRPIEPDRARALEPQLIGTTGIKSSE